MRRAKLVPLSTLGVLLLIVAFGCGESTSDVTEQPHCAPATEACNGADDDCDGDIDEGLLEAITCGLGACQASVPACVDGVPGVCTPLAPRASEACDGTDDDCDGQVDEGCECVPGEARSCYGGPPATAGLGACVTGMQRCEAGRWGTCAGAVLPAPERCNGVDDDCDGALDEEPTDVGAGCATGLPGVCGVGVARCAEGRLLCVQAAAPTADLCNGLDDDCDPVTPDGAGEAWFGNPCDGSDGDLCMEGALACVGGAQACGDTTETALEACNGADDDCDGFYDEGFVVDANPLCQDAAILGTLDGSTPTLSTTGYAETFLRVRIADHGVGAGSLLAAKLTLWAPSGSYLQPYVRCASCAGLELGPTSHGYSNGYYVYSVAIARAATAGDDGFDLLVELRDGYTAWRCGVWQLVIERDTGATTATCP